MDMLNQFTKSSSFYKIMMTTCSPEQPMKTMPCIISFPVPSPLVITCEILDMACRSVLSNLNCTKRHLLTEFYLVSAANPTIDIFVVFLYLGIDFVILCFLVLFRFSFIVGLHVFYSHIIVTSRDFRDIL